MSKQDPTTAQIDQVIKEVTTAKPGEAPLELQIGPNEVFKGTPQEVLESLAKAKQNANSHIERIEAENREFKTKLSELEQKIPKPQPSADETKNAEYYKTWAQDPTKANMQALAAGLGIPEDQLIPLLRGAIATTTSQTAAQEFLSWHPEFPETPQNAAIINARLAKEFGTGPGAATARNLESVYMAAVRDGEITPKHVPATGIEGGYVPLPNIRGGSAPPDETASLTQRLMDLPIDEHKKVLDRLLAQAGGRR